MCIGSIVDLLGNAAWLLSPNTDLCIERILDNLLVKIFINNFCEHSKRVIGRVLFKSRFHSPGLGIGYITPLLHIFGNNPIFNKIL